MVSKTAAGTESKSHPTDFAEKKELMKMFADSYQLKDMPAALKYISRIIEIEGNPEYYILRAKVHDNLGNPAEAIRDLKTAIELQDVPFYHLALSKIYFKSGEHALSVISFNKSIRKGHQFLLIRGDEIVPTITAPVGKDGPQAFFDAFDMINSMPKLHAESLRRKAESN